MYYFIPSINWLTDDMSKELNLEKDYCKFIIRQTIFGIARNKLVGELPWDQMENIEKYREENIDNICAYLVDGFDLTEECIEFHKTSIAWMIDVIINQVLDVGDHATYQKVMFVQGLMDKIREDTEKEKKKAERKAKKEATLKEAKCSAEVN